MSEGAFSSDMVYSMNDLSEIKAYAFDRGVEIILGTVVINDLFLFILYISRVFLFNTYPYPLTIIQSTHVHHY